MQPPDLTGRRVMITGGLGFIGSNLARRCLQAGAQVTIYDCLEPRSGGNLANIRGFTDRVTLAFHDIVNFDQLTERVVGQDIIFNAAASTSHAFSMVEPLADLDVNGRGVIQLLEAVRRFNPTARLIQLGTTTQFGRLNYRPADEQHPEFPCDIYSANKCAAEKYVLIYARAHGLRATAVRLSNTYGPRACIHSPEYTFNNFFIGQALRGRAVTVFGEGKQLRNVLYVEDAVDALLAVATSEAAIGQPLLVAGDEHRSIAELAEATVRVMGSGRVDFVGWPAERQSIEIGDAIISNEKLKAITGWQPAHDLDAGLAKTRAYFADCLEAYLK